MALLPETDGPHLGGLPTIPTPASGPPELSSSYLSLELLKSQKRGGPPLRILGHAVQFINTSVRGSAPQVPGLILS